MKRPAALAAFAALTVALATTVAPAFAARSTYVIDDAHLLSSSATAQINQQIATFNAQTGKEVLVVITSSLDGVAPDAALERSFAQQQVNGVEIFIAKDEKQIKIAGDVASRRFFPSGSFNTIYQAMRPYFAQGNYDQGVETGVSLVINTYLGHASSLNRARQPVGATAPVRYRSSNSGGWGLGFIWWIIILAVIFFIIRGIFRAMAGPRMYGGGGPGYGPGPGYGGPGYGPGYGGYGGGGGFWSGLLGGLGGAWLGNELFGGRNYGAGPVDGGTWANTGGVDPGASADASGWQSDAGQIDTGNVGGGGWGDSGGDSGGGGGWGGGDFGGGGGGGGDSGGGW
ncbi:MAG TPA: TPM domain-containing protein [Candidatus Elarobacter sp.]|jgi:uncharacterized membrane protein YgcG|nr:TPM domain-containing protein [Candidatus Elarobacter sp.]